MPLWLSLPKPLHQSLPPFCQLARLASPRASVTQPAVQPRGQVVATPAQSAFLHEHGQTGSLARRAVLRRAADERGVFLGDEVMDFMLNRFSRDLTSLMMLLDQLDAYALRTQRAITIPLLKSMLENE